MNKNVETLDLTGRAAPDPPVEDGTGNEVPLSNFWKKSPLVLVFMRQLG